MYGERFVDITIASYDEWGAYSCVIEIGSERFESLVLEITEFPGTIIDYLIFI